MPRVAFDEDEGSSPTRTTHQRDIGIMSSPRRLAHGAQARVELERFGSLRVLTLRKLGRPPQISTHHRTQNERSHGPRKRQD